jgi:hypothetical protein
MNHISPNIPVLFLDFDGVINIDAGEFHPPCMQQLNRLLQTTLPTLVISSSWRRTCDIDDLQKVLRDNGVDYAISDVTPELYAYKKDGVVVASAPRGLEIMAFRKCHRIKSCVALDDWDDIWMQDILIQTKYATGITEEIADEVIKRLNI